MIRSLSLLATLASLAVLAGCADSGGLAPRGTQAEANDFHADRTLADARIADDTWPDSHWWEKLGDPQLNALVAEAFADSPALATAQARVDRARAAVGTVHAGLLPQVDANVQSTRQRFSEHDIVPPPYGGTWQTLNRAALDFGYEFDLRGVDSADLAAAVSAAEAAHIDAVAARLMLSVAVSSEYVQLARIFEQLDIARAELEQRRQLYDLTRQRVDAGLENRVPLKQAEAALPAVLERIAAFEEQEALTRNRIAALLGKGPDRGLDIERPVLAAESQEAVLPSQLPADLLGRRPDVVASRWRVEAASHGIDVARARFYPDLNLTAFVGLKSIGLSDFLDAGSRIAGIGPALHLPVFEGGELRSNLATADADYDVAVAHYNESLIDALRDLGDQLSSIRSVETQKRQQRVALDAASEAYELALLRYRGGIGNYLDVLSAQGQMLVQERLAAELRARDFINRIELVRALGGGVDVAAPDAPAT